MVFNPNLAPIRYRNILTSAGGPIEKITLQNKPNRLHPFQAFAYLKNTLITPALSVASESPDKPFVFYGNQNGTGSGKSIYEATSKAISEALERWAFTEAIASYKSKNYFYHIDPSTSGMAAFPGIFPNSARSFAKNEALERWAIGAWWDGLLPLEELHSPSLSNIHAYRIHSPMESTRFVILLSTSSTPFAYGFAADTTLQLAFRRAHDELSRNLSVLKNKNPTLDSSNQLNHVEENLLKWSTSDSFKTFQNKVAVSKNVRIKVNAPKVACDTEVKGPWSKYASVWRFLYEPISSSQLIGNQSCEFLF